MVLHAFWKVLFSANVSTCKRLVISRKLFRISGSRDPDIRLVSQSNKRGNSSYPVRATSSQNNKQEVSIKVPYLSVAEVNLRESCEDLAELFGQRFVETLALDGWHDDIKLALCHIDGNVNLEHTPAHKTTPAHNLLANHFVHVGQTALRNIDCLVGKSIPTSRFD